MSDELLRFPRGQISLGGDLRQATDATFKFANGAKAKATLRSQGRTVGVVMGTEDTGGQFTCIIDADGPERDWETYLATLKGANFKFKCATTTFAVNGVVTEINGTFPNDDSISLQISWIGRKV